MVPKDAIESLVIPLIVMTFEKSIIEFKTEECLITEMSAWVSTNRLIVVLDASLSS